MKNRSRRPSALLLTLCSASAAYSCLGTETGNPIAELPDVVNGTSPENFGEPVVPPPCPPIPLEEYPNVPSPLPGVLVATANGTDPLQPVLLDRLDVRGNTHQWLGGAPGQLWVVASEVPVVDGNAMPTADQLELQLRLIQFDVSDPTAPVRVAQVDLDGDLWEMRQRGAQIWVASVRRVAAQRACDAPQSSAFNCVYPLYEALVVQGFRPGGATLERVAAGEIPYERRAWWGADGIGSIVPDGLHVLSWDEGGALRAPITMGDSGSGAPLGPIDIEGNELRVVGGGQGRLTLDVYGLGATATAVSAFNLGARTTAPGGYSLFSSGHLWLQSAQWDPSPAAEVWDLAGDEPVRLELPAPYVAVLPIDGATRADQTDELLAIGWTRDPAVGDVASLLSLRDGRVTVLEPALFTEGLYNNRGQNIAAPVGLQGVGAAPAWRLVIRGMGFPVGIAPVLPPASEERFLAASVAVAAEGAGQAGRTLVEATLIDARPNPVLEVSGGGSTTRFELSPAARDLVPTRTGVVAVATTEAAQCEQSGRDCTGYAPGVEVFELTGEPRRTGALSFPALPIAPADPSRVSVNWRTYDPITQLDRLALTLDERHLAFVAQVDLSCDTPEYCDALGLVAVPIAEANVATGGQVTCPPSDVAPDCVPMAAPVPSVYGTGQRQYFYVLDLDAPGGPAWQSWGTSTLEASAARTDRDSRFAAPIATDGVLAATRLERRTAAGEVVAPGEARFMLDRFELQPSGEPSALPPVNVRGYPQARLGTNAGVERWLSAEAATGPTGATGEARLLRLNIRDDGARIERELALGGGRFAGLRVLDLETDLEAGQRLGLALTTPDDACGSTRLSAIRLGSSTGDAAEPLEIASTLELPADRWTLAATDGPYALLSRGVVHVLVHVDAQGTLSITGSRSLDVAAYTTQLFGTTFFGAGPNGTRVIEFAASP